MRADLSAYGLDPVVRRSERAFWEEIVRRLQEKFNAVIVEVVSDVSKKVEGNRLPLRRPQVRKKDLRAVEFVYANPFVEDKSHLFGKYPDWLLAWSAEELKDPEKLIYGRLLFPLPPICERWNKELGVIIGLNQGELGNALSKNRTTVNKWLISLQAKKWLKCDGPSGARQTIKFLW